MFREYLQLLYQMYLIDLKYHFVTNEIDTYFRKDPTDIDKYLVCTCARGENDYIIEFVNHY